jgi:predicted acetyltransferase
MDWLLKLGVTVVLTEDDDPEHILGWCNVIVDAKGAVTFSYVYVKHSFRGNGFARMMIKSVLENFPSEKRYFCNVAPSAKSLIKEFGLMYNPYIWDLSNFVEENK